MSAESNGRHASAGGGAGIAPESALAARTRPSPKHGRGAATLLWIVLAVLVVALMSDVDYKSDTWWDLFAWNLLGSLALLIALGCLTIWLSKANRARAEWLQRNESDYRASQVLDQQLSVAARQHEPLSDASPRIWSIHDARVGEVSQHFDQRFSAAVTGWLHHELGFHGWGVGVGVGRFGLGTGKLGLSGSSSVNLDVNGVLRDDLSGDGFVAVLERDLPGGTIDTVRVIVPSEPACREYIANLMTAIGASFGSGSHLDDVCQKRGPQLASAFPCNVAHVSDQLRAVLRQSPERRPLVSVVGEDLGASVVLGGAIRLGADGPWQQLFPISCSDAILSVVTEQITGGLLTPAIEV